MLVLVLQLALRACFLTVGLMKRLAMCARVVCECIPMVPDVWA